MMLVDSHCHLNFPEFTEDIDAVMERAQAAGTCVMQTICTKLNEFQAILDIANRYDHVYCSVGVHPNHETENTFTAQHLIAKTLHKKVIGLGETGLDYYRDYDKSIQIKNFIEHIKAAQATGLPLIVHTREADEDTISILSKYMKEKPFKGLIHCFTASQRLADTVLEMGFYISFSGIITFKNAIHLHEIAKTIPIDRILVETDAPYLAPVPFRGKRNEPSYVAYTNRTLANLRGISEEACANATTENFFCLFDKAKRP